MDLNSNTADRLSPWEELKDALTASIQEIRRSTYLRIEDKSKHLFAQDLAGLDASVKALEKQLTEIRARLRAEASTIPKIQALLQAQKAQEADIHMLAANLPPHLPGQQAAYCQDTSASDDIKQGRGRDTDTSAAGFGGKKEVQKQAKQPQQQAPRTYVTESELNGVASYMKGRLSLDKVNAALDELAGFADANLKLMASAKQGSNKLPPAERKRATELLHSIGNRDGIKGRTWFLETDIKDGLNIKLDKTGRSILTVLRHLNRLQEVRCSLEGNSCTVYVMQ